MMIYHRFFMCLLHYDNELVKSILKAYMLIIIEEKKVK